MVQGLKRSVSGLNLLVLRPRLRNNANDTCARHTASNDARAQVSASAERERAGLLSKISVYEGRQEAQLTVIAESADSLAELQGALEEAQVGPHFTPMIARCCVILFLKE